jgi:hypothetical protein
MFFLAMLNLDGRSYSRIPSVHFDRYASVLKMPKKYLLKFIKCDFGAGLSGASPILGPAFGASIAPVLVPETALPMRTLQFSSHRKLKIIVAHAFPNLV